MNECLLFTMKSLRLKIICVIMLVIFKDVALFFCSNILFSYYFVAYLGFFFFFNDSFLGTLPLSLEINQLVKPDTFER